MDRVTQAKIESLRYALRSLAPGAEPPSVDELARRYQLDPLIVRRLAEAEGVAVRGGETEPQEAPDPRSPTGVIDVSEMDWAKQTDDS